MKPQEELLLRESNLIEGVGEEGLEDSKQAYLYLMQVREPLTEKHILKTHRLLMRSLNPEIAGKIRKVSVGIYSGGVCIKTCPKPEEISNLMKEVLYKINSSLKFNAIPLEKEKMALECHIDFEKMHPFEDGNGRTGRLILNWQRKQMGLPLLIVFDKDKQEYYKNFK
jgi:Fic family protein